MGEDRPDLQEELGKRKQWFYECQLRRLNLHHFREVNADDTNNPLLNLISEIDTSVTASNGDAPTRVYLDSGVPVWTLHERWRRDGFKQTFTGAYCDWFDFKDPHRLAAKVGELKTEYEDHKISPSIWDFHRLNLFVRTPPEVDTWDGKARAVCRAVLAETRPWLIPELYPPVFIPPPTPDGKVPDWLVSHPYPSRTDPFFMLRWLDDLESYVTDTENELEIVSAGSAERPDGIDKLDGAETTEKYRAWIKTMVALSVYRSTPPSVTVSFLRERPDSSGWDFDILLSTHIAGSPGRLSFFGRAVKFPYSAKVRYWARVIEASMREVYINKPDSDMGLCLLIRILYLFGTLPSDVGVPGWRERKADDEKFTGEAEFNAFFDDRERDFTVAVNNALRGIGAQTVEEITANVDRAIANLDRLKAVRQRFTVLLEAFAVGPRTTSIVFSPIVGEMLRAAITAYKFWLDEPLRALTSDKLQKVRADVLGGDAEPKAEMEYWSENHYIMFASSEYLAGQLWPDETFQPGKGYVDPELKTPWGTVEGTLEMSGIRRKERGKARVLKWLNNRLRFGWAEFNSSGYYREHLQALLNLGDFAVDSEVREKARIAIDLLMFDMMRYHHKGGMGAAGGRSQFKSKVSAWDNATGDVVEMLLGTRGLFGDGDSQIGAHFATSTYDVPDVLLEIGAYPVSGVDRSRVSITFDEAPRYAINTADNSDEMNSIRAGYADKVRKYYKFVIDAYQTIEDTHYDYTGYDDDVVFWWTTSAYLNDPIRRETLRCIGKFQLNETGVFKELAGFIAVVAELVDLGSLLDGSTRTRANIITYRTPQFMMSSVQNFRPGQLNFQSSVSQVSLTGALRVFTTAGFGGLDISDLYLTLGGALAGSVAGGFVGGLAATVTGNFLLAGAGAGLGALTGAGGALYANYAEIDGLNPLGSGAKVDGPSWWTGYWALPMVFQEGAATILAYDFNSTQEFLTETGTHLWFPKAGFDRTDTMRASGYDDDNNIVSEVIGEITTLFSEPEEFLSSRGYWLFGLVKESGAVPAESDPAETYVGVFSNKKPRFLSLDDNEEDTYQRALEELRENVPKDEEGKKNHAEAWKDPLPRDYFADRDYYANGKNIWIIQLGTKDEFGSYEAFKNRVSEATVKIDDRGDMACTYFMPLPTVQDNPVSPIFGRPAKELTLDFEDGGSFKVNGAAAKTDLYPRFENAYVRSGRVEWGQRAYMIEHEGKQLIHDFANFSNPLRLSRASKEEVFDRTAALTVRALVIYATTGESEMEINTVGTASVRCGCDVLTDDQVIAAGPIDSDTTHDAEWIFLDRAAQFRPDLTLTLRHKAIRGGDGDAEWDVTYSMKALMGDYTLRDCAISFPQGHFGKGREAITPFSVPTHGWQPWEQLSSRSEPPFDIAFATSVMVADQPSWSTAYYDHFDLFATDDRARMRHRRVQSCPQSPGWFHLPTRPDLDFADPYSLSAISRFPGHLMAAVVNNGGLFVTSRDHNGNWLHWKRIQPFIYPPGLFGLPDTDNPQDVNPYIPGAVFSRPAVGSIDGIDLFFIGEQEHLYLHRDWAPARQGAWRKIDKPAGANLSDPAKCAVSGDEVFTLDALGGLWGITIPGDKGQSTGQWRKLNEDGPAFATFTLVPESNPVRILATDAEENLWTIEFHPWLPLTWRFLSGPPADSIPSGVPVAASSEGDCVDAYAVTNGGQVVTMTFTDDTTQPWAPLLPPQPFFAARHQPLAVKRVKRQVEVVVAAASGELFRTWRA